MRDDLRPLPGQAGDGPCGRQLRRDWGATGRRCALIMDRAYEGDETRQMALELGFVPVVPPHPQRTRPWKYDLVLYAKRNEVERLLRLLKGFRRVFTRFDKLDSMFTSFLHFALAIIALS